VSSHKRKRGGKRPLNPALIYLKKEKDPKTRTFKRIVMMSQFDDDEDREILLKR
jgi:hypothetical protein